MILWSYVYFHSRYALPSMSNHCCKRPNCDFGISHGSVATELRLGGQKLVIYVQFLPDVPRLNLLQLANVSRSFSKNINGTVILRYGVMDKTKSQFLKCCCHTYIATLKVHECVHNWTVVTCEMTAQRCSGFRVSHNVNVNTYYRLSP